MEWERKDGISRSSFRIEREGWIEKKERRRRGRERKRTEEEEE
jgi:hypothetical protein